MSRITWESTLRCLIMVFKRCWLLVTMRDCVSGVTRHPDPMVSEAVLAMSSHTTCRSTLDQSPTALYNVPCASCTMLMYASEPQNNSTPTSIIFVTGATGVWLHDSHVVHLLCDKHGLMNGLLLLEVMFNHFASCRLTNYGFNLILRHFCLFFCAFPMFFLFPSSPRICLTPPLAKKSTFPGEKLTHVHGGRRFR